MQRAQAVMQAGDGRKQWSRGLLGLEKLGDIPAGAVLLYGAVFLALNGAL